MGRRGCQLLVLLALAGFFAPRADAAGPPTIAAEWVTGVTSSSAVLKAEIDPEGLGTHYRFEYLALAAYEANLAAEREPFAGAKSVPSPDGGLGSGNSAITVSFPLTAPLNALSPDTVYRYRAVATNEADVTVGSVRSLRTKAATPPPRLLDERGWEMVSPVDKAGGSVAAPEALFGGGDIQAATQGGALTYGSATAFVNPQAAPPVSQYVSQRGPGGWSTVNISAASEPGGYGDEPDGAPFKLFSEDLARALLLDPHSCEPAEPCPRNYSLRQSTGALTPLPAQAAGMRVLSASPDLARVRFESEGGVYEWSGGGLVPISLLPPTAGVGAAFQADSADSRFIFYIESGKLYRYDADSQAATDLTPSGDVVGVLAVAPDGSRAYYQDGSGLELWHEGAVRQIAPGSDATLASDYPPATATVRIGAGGRVIAFLSAASIGGYDNTDVATGLPDTEVYLYESESGALVCASCNPTGERPRGSASIPGALVNGTTTAYRPRALSADGRRLFFESAEALVDTDTDSSIDVYEWEAPGEGNCSSAPGCVGLVSGGRGEGGRFLDASADGADAFFLTGDSLVGSDPGSLDAYDARVGGGLPEPQLPIACDGDACQPLPSPPGDPTAGTSVEGAGNPPPHYAKERRRNARKHRHRRHHHHRKPRGGRAPR
jgi:hypothetical protein